MRSIHVFLSIDYCFDACCCCCCCCCCCLRSLVARALSSNAIALASISISFSFKAFCLNSLDSRVVGTVEEALFLGVAYGDVLAKLRFISSLSSKRCTHRWFPCTSDLRQKIYCCYSRCEYSYCSCYRYQKTKSSFSATLS